MQIKKVAVSAAIVAALAVRGEAKAPVKCPYCLKEDQTWKDSDLRAGKCNTPTGILYHCYEGYALD